MGRSDIFLKLEIIKKILDLLIVIVTLLISPFAMALGLLAEGVLCLFINSVPNRKLINYSFAEQLMDIFPSVLIALIMGIPVFAVSLFGWGNLITLIIQVPLGAAVYLLMSKITKSESFEYILSIVRTYLNHGKK